MTLPWTQLRRCRLAARRRRNGGVDDHARCAGVAQPCAAASERVEATPRAAAAAGVAKFTALDAAALMAAVGEAEAGGQVKRLPGLYLSLAQWRLDSGETSAAADLLRKSILGATTCGAEGCARQGAPGAGRHRA